MGVEAFSEADVISEFNPELKDLKDDLKFKRTSRSKIRKEMDKVIEEKGKVSTDYVKDLNESVIEFGNKIMIGQRKEKIRKQTNFSLDDIKFIDKYMSGSWRDLNFEKVDNEAIKFLCDEGKYDELNYVLCKLKTLDLDLANILVNAAKNPSKKDGRRFHGVDINLDGLQTISDEVLDTLVRGPFNILTLGIKNISNKQADILSNFKGWSLDFVNLTEISDYAAEKLAEKKKHLHFSSLKELTDKQYDILSSLDDDGDSLDIYGDYSVDYSSDKFETLTPHQIQNGILLKGARFEPKYMSDDVAKAIGEQGFHGISFSSLKSITDEQMNLLFANYKLEDHQFDNEFDFSGLSKITDEQIKILAKSGNLKLDGLTNITDRQAKILKENWSGQLTYCGEGQYDAGLLSLTGLTKISDSQLDDLLSIPACKIDLSGIKELSDGQVSIIKKHVRDLDKGFPDYLENYDGPYPGESSGVTFGAGNSLTQYQKELLGLDKDVDNYRDTAVHVYDNELSVELPYPSEERCKRYMKKIN